MNQHDCIDDIVKSVDTKDDFARIELTGEIDMGCAMGLRSTLMEIIQQRPTTVMIIMSEVDFMDSSGLATLVEALQACRKYQGHLKLIGLTQRVRNVFEISRLDTIFELFDTEEEALA